MLCALLPRHVWRPWCRKSWRRVSPQRKKFTSKSFWRANLAPVALRRLNGFASVASLTATLLTSCRKRCHSHASRCRWMELVRAWHLPTCPCPWRQDRQNRFFAYCSCWVIDGLLHTHQVQSIISISSITFNSFVGSIFIQKRRIAGPHPRVICPSRQSPWLLAPRRWYRWQASNLGQLERAYHWEGAPRDLCRCAETACCVLSQIFVGHSLQFNISRRTIMLLCPNCIQQNRLL